MLSGSRILLLKMGKNFFISDSVEYPLRLENHLLEDEWQGLEATPSKRPRNDNQNETFIVIDEDETDLLQQKTMEVLQVGSAFFSAHKLISS